MKRITVILALIMLFVVSACAADYIVWDFSNPDDVAKWAPSKTTNVEVTEKGAVITGSGDDINLTFVPAEGETINLEDYAILAVGYRDFTTGGRMQFYHWTEGCTGNPRAEDTVRSSYIGTFKFDMKNAAPGTAKWNGKVTKLRLDPCRASDERSHTIEYVGLFKDAVTYAAYSSGAMEEVPSEILPGQPAKIFNLSKKNAAFGMSGTNCVIEYTDDYGIVTSFGGPEEGGKNVGDPYVTLVNQHLDAQKYPWIKFRVRNLSDATQFEMHFASTATGDKITGSSCTHFPISSKDEDFVEYIFNIKDANLASQGINPDESQSTSVWSGTISQLRFDCMWKAEPSGQMATGSQMYVDYIAFFASEEDAKNYVPTEDTKVEKPRINSGKANPVWIFDSEEAIESFESGGMNVSLEAGVMVVNPTSHDPMMTFTLTEDEYFNCLEFPYFAYRHKTTSTVTRGGLFFTTSDLPTLSDASYSPFDFPAKGQWENTITDLSDTSKYKGNWVGTCNLFRLDPINGTDTNASIYISRMGFFRTLSEAYEFLSSDTSDFDYTKGAEFSAKMQTSIAPPGALSANYNRNDYLLTSTTPVGEGTDPVVIRTNSDGTQEIVAMSYTNGYGYTTFVANKPATYTLGYNTKQYSDIAGHWGEQYINFVSNRTLFGGTSPTEFSPEDTMTRGMFITVLGRMHGVDTAKYDGNTGYGDIPATEYYAPYIQWAKEFGLMAPLSEVTFGAEDPIDRATMSVVIANYCNTFDFNMQGYEDEMTFTDLADCDSVTIEAIKSMQMLGILNGKGEGRFDPKGLSTRAEVATVMQRVIKTALGVNMASTTYAPEYFQRERIRIGAWGFMSPFGTPEGMKLLRDLGVDTIISGNASSGSKSRDYVFNYADKYGIEVFAQDVPFTSQVLENNYNYRDHVSSYGDHPSFSGHNLVDEPGTDSFGWMGDVADIYMKQLPGKIPFVNLLPMYANAAQLKLGANAAAIEYYDADPELYRKYCQAWFENFNVDYICTDIYPLNGHNGKENIASWSTYNDYCESINQIATVARENDAEFWCCIQTWGWTRGKRNPTEAEYRWQSYAMLSYGCTGILLWSLKSSNETDFPSVLNTTTLKPTQPLYDDCATVMWELRKLSDTYIQYKNLGAFTLNCTSATPWLKMSGEYENFGILSETVSDEPLLIGCFEKKEGTGYAFTVVNMTDIKEQKPATLKFKTAQPLTVTLYDEAVPTVLTADANGYYTISLETTDGVFVTVG
ncbi:MAG: S-layer homology domain-containing protein [Ruminococcaceae bacterium]|nr:S-layer homology domain-containing protein [Oscillospiraceae bacterium]